MTILITILTVRQTRKHKLQAKLRCHLYPCLEQTNFPLFTRPHTSPLPSLLPSYFASLISPSSCIVSWPFIPFLIPLSLSPLSSASPVLSFFPLPPYFIFGFLLQRPNPLCTVSFPFMPFIFLSFSACIYTVKKRFGSFPSPAGMSLPNSPWAGIMTS
jgi:hypothetical protein